MRERITRSLVILSLVFSLMAAGCTRPEKETLRVFIAGSLMVPFAELESAYEALNPGVDVYVEAHGSIQVIRHVTEIHDLIDVVVPADYALIPMLMYPTIVPESDQPYADWTINFATNKLALAYTPKSLYADEINENNWYEIIAREDVQLGLADPRFDASGYRTLMIMQMAENYYSDPTIFEQVYLGRFTNPIKVRKNSEMVSIHVPEVLEPSEESNIILRGGSVALLGVLESGDVDYAFEYESVIQQHGLEYVSLPPELNMGNEDFQEAYKAIQVELDFRRFSSVEPKFSGNLIEYGITIPANAPNPERAEDFIAFILSDQGRQIIQESQHPLLIPARVDHHDNVPDSLRSLCEPVP